MNVNFPSPWLTAYPHPLQQTIDRAKQLIHSDDVEQLEELETLLEESHITANTPSGVNGEGLMHCAVRQYAHFFFLRHGHRTRGGGRGRY